jgi:hypothetical protein
MSAHPGFYPYVHGLLLGDDDATKFFLDFFEVAHTLDDLVDRDTDVGDAEIVGAFRRALLDIPQNMFYRQYFRDLQPLFSVALLNWLAATKMERAGTESPVAFAIRSDYCNVLLKCMEIVGGFDHANKHWHEVRTWWHQEGLNGYGHALEKEAADRRAKGH